MVFHNRPDTAHRGHWPLSITGSVCFITHSTGTPAQCRAGVGQRRPGVAPASFHHVTGFSSNIRIISRGYLAGTWMDERARDTVTGSRVGATNKLDILKGVGDRAPDRAVEHPRYRGTFYSGNDTRDRVILVAHRKCITSIASSLPVE